MKKLKLFYATIAALLTVGSAAAATVVSPYSCDFERHINTSNPLFKVASNWQHVVNTTDDDASYMSYSYSTAGGYDESACLYAGDGTSFADYLVTPLVSGSVSMRVKLLDTSDSYVEVYAAGADGTVGNLITTVNSSYIQSSTGESSVTFSEWYQVPLITVPLNGFQRLYLHCNKVYIDDFSASSASITPEASMSIESAVPSDTAGLIHWDQQPNGKVLIDYVVTVKNDGDLELTPGMDGYSITVFDNESGVDLFTVAVPVTLAVGAVSDEFHVSAEVNPADVWTTSQRYLYLRENINNGIVERAWADYRSYGAVFSLHEDGSIYTASSCEFGIVTEDATKTYRIYNNGNALLTVKSITLPDGFTGGIEAPLEIAAGESATFSITLPASKPGSYSGDVVITYLDRPATVDGATDKSYSLAVSGTVVDANTWTCDFGTGSTATEQFPVGTVGRAGIYVESLTTGNSIYGVTYNAQFITPLLSLKPGDTVSFDAKYKTSGATMKLYATKDRNSYSDPVATISPTSEYTTRTVTLSDIEEGNYYLVFEIPNVYIDNITAPKKVDVAYDLYFTPSDTDKDTNSIQRGESYTRTVDVIAPVTMAADDYTLQLMANGVAVATANSIDMSADAKSTHPFSFSWTPEVERTTVFDTYVQATFPDGTTQCSTSCELTVNYQPEFCFLTAGSSASASKWWKPNSVSQAVDFGTGKEIGATKSYEIYNWGTAPLTVTSVEMPEGFTANVSSCTVASKEWQDFVITFSPTEPGSYKGDMVIKYLDMDGTEESYTLGISGTLLDASKWYTDFSQVGDTFTEYPAGTIAGTNVSGANIGSSSSDPVWAITSMNDTENMLVSPKLTAEKSEIIRLNARLYNTTDSWQDGYVKVYAAETREDLDSDDTRTFVGEISGVSDDEETLVDGTVFKDFEMEMPSDGDYYLGFAIGGRLQLHSIYGLTLVDVAHDLQLAGYAISASAVQNNLKEMQISVRNFGLKAEQPGDYKVAAFVGGEKMVDIDGPVEIPLCHKYTGDSTSIPVSMRCPKVGTYPVYLQLTADDLVLTTDPVDVTFAEETLSKEVQVGETKSVATGSKGVLCLNWNNCEHLSYFSAEELGLSAGDKISKIVIKGYNTLSATDYPFNIKLAYEWVDGEITFPTGSTTEFYDTTGMTFLTGYTLPAAGSSSELADMITYNFPEPIAYQAGKALKLYICSSAENTKNTGYGFEMSATTTDSENHFWDAKAKTWNAISKPVLHISVAMEPPTVSGVVTDGGVAVEGATVTLVSADGENVRYQGVSDAEGKYSVGIVQSERSYDVTALKGDKMDYVLNQQYDGKHTQDFALMTYVKVAADADFTARADEAIVDFSLPLTAGYNAVVLPFALSEAEATELFGENCEILKFAGSELQEGQLHAYFKHVAAGSGMKAANPYIINATKAAEPVRYRGKAVDNTVWNDVYENASFYGTFVAKEMTAGNYLLNDDNFVAAAAKARAAEMIAPFTAYLNVTADAVTDVVWTIDDEFTSGIETISADMLSDDDLIYNLQGQRVKNPDHGIFIRVNGKNTQKIRL
jgi:hypothetical protein